MSKTQTIDFDGKATMRINGGRVEVFLNSPALSGSHCLSVKTDGATGQTLSQHIYARLLADIDGATVNQDTGVVEYYDGQVRLYSLTYIHSSTPRIDLRFCAKSATHDTPNLVQHIADLRAIIAAMGWNGMEINPVTFSAQGKAFKQLLTMTPENGILRVKNTKLRLRPELHEGKIALFGAVPEVKNSAVFIKGFLGLLTELDLDLTPVVLTPNALTTDEFESVVQTLMTSGIDLSGLHLLHTNGKRAQLWSGSDPAHKLSATTEYLNPADEVGCSTILSRVRRFVYNLYDNEVIGINNGPASIEDEHKLLNTCIKMWTEPLHAVRMATEEEMYALPAQKTQSSDRDWLNTTVTAQDYLRATLVRADEVQPGDVIWVDEGVEMTWGHNSRSSEGEVRAVLSVTAQPEGKVLLTLDEQYNTLLRKYATYGVGQLVRRLASV